MERTNRIPCRLTKLAARDVGGFEGWASVFNTLIDDHYKTRIMPGAFATTLKDGGRRVKVLYQHDADNPIGRPIELRETPRGLFVKAELASTPRAQEVRALLHDKVVEELSIGFDPINWETVGEERHIHELKLWEVSLVTFGANPDARVTEVHRRRLGRPLSSYDVQIDLLELDLLLANAGLLRGDVRR